MLPMKILLNNVKPNTTQLQSVQEVSLSFTLELFLNVKDPSLVGLVLPRKDPSEAKPGSSLAFEEHVQWNRLPSARHCVITSVKMPTFVQSSSSDL